jgi:1,4-alpha-glucan branching enzyme
MQKDPVYRKFHHNLLTFGMLYAFHENFVLPLSHDEVVHGKGSMVNKMPGDDWQKFANLRLLLGYQFTHPGKKLIFMGTELAVRKEWDFAAQIDWELLEKDERRQHFFNFCRDLVRLYRHWPALWRRDSDDSGFSWIDCRDHHNSILIYQRRGNPEETLLCILNLTPLTHFDYRIGLPAAGGWREVFNSDAALYGGSNQGNLGRIEAQALSFHNQPASAGITIPPLALLVLEKENPQPTH